MKPAVGVEHLAGGEVQQAARRRQHAGGHVFRLPEPADGGDPSSSIIRLYFSSTPAVMSVRMMPGRTSKTGMP